MWRRSDVGDTRMGRGNSQVGEKRELREGRGRRMCACRNGCNKAVWLVSTVLVVLTRRHTGEIGAGYGRYKAF